MKDWLSKNTNPLFALLGFVVLVVGIDLAPAWLFDKLGSLADRVMADPAGSASALLVIVGALATAVGMLRAAWQRDPKATSSKPQKVSSTEGSSPIHVLAYITIASLFGLAGCALLLPGCGQTTPVAQQATAIEVAAITVSTAAQVISLAADADVRSTCPEGSDPACVDPVAARWAPIDASILASRSALGAWLGADRIAAAANTDPIAEALDEIGVFVRAYLDLRAAAALLDVDIPPLPGPVCALAGVPVDACTTTSGGVS